VVADGEEGAREGFPFDTADGEVAFEDGWTLTFDRYLVSLGDLEVASSDGETGVASEAVYVFDLTQGTPRLEELIDLGVRRWDEFSFSIRAPGRDEPVKLSGGATQADADLMRDGDLNYFIEATAEKDGQIVTLAWGLDNPTDNRDCTNGLDEKPGVVVKANTATEAVITFHVEHLFWDALGSEQTRLRFDAIAALADDTGQVPWAALADQMLADLTNADGDPLVDANGTRVTYDPGSSGLLRNDLQQFILTSTRTQAHLNGNGLCTITAQ
jgi:hypothetical protein